MIVSRVLRVAGLKGETLGRSGNLLTIAGCSDVSNCLACADNEDGHHWEYERAVDC